MPMFAIASALRPACNNQQVEKNSPHVYIRINDFIVIIPSDKITEYFDKLPMRGVLTEFHGIGYMCVDNTVVLYVINDVDIRCFSLNYKIKNISIRKSMHIQSYLIEIRNFCISIDTWRNCISLLDYRMHSTWKIIARMELKNGKEKYFIRKHCNKRLKRGIRFLFYHVDYVKLFDGIIQRIEAAIFKTDYFTKSLDVDSAFRRLDTAINSETYNIIHGEFDE